MFIEQQNLQDLRANNLISWEDDNDFEEMMTEALTRLGVIIPTVSIAELTERTYVGLCKRGIVRKITNGRETFSVVEREVFAAAATLTAAEERVKQDRKFGHLFLPEAVDAFCREVTKEK